MRSSPGTVRRKLIPLAIAVALSALIGGLSNVFDWPAPVTYGLGGVLLSLIVIFGTPYAFGAPSPWRFFELRDVVEANQPAVGADQQQNGEASPNG